MPSQAELDRFAAWAITRYTQRTVAKLRADVRTMCANRGVPPEATRRIKRIKDYAWAWDVWGDAIADGVKLAPLPIERPVVPAAPLRGGRRAHEPKRVREAVALSSADYGRMLESLAQDKRPAARLVELLGHTGLRVADALRVRLADLRAALADGEDGVLPVLVKGDKPALVSLQPAHALWLELERLAPPGAVTLADVVTGVPGSDTEASGAAYERCRRVMKRHGKVLGLDGRLHLHRLRRTVGVELLRRGASIEDVQQVLIHDSTKTTERSYADEYRAEQARAALARLKERNR